ncbi:MAG: TonB-dependent receptor, partial [Gammaproteobacteria bacterium]|nr:TonB-dependent receptor [Gammaproteobacteria bacterium]
MSSRRSIAAGLAVCLGTVAAVATSPAFAQATGAAGPIREEILVTGSRIARADLEAVSPIVVVQSDTLEKLNITNAEEFLRQLPQFAAGIGANTNNGNDGSSTVDLRNLGEERTLVLVNGKRFVPFDYQGYVDVAMIPARLIERVEIITGGASAVYGSEAIAGVVNFILKNEFEGAAVDGSYNVTEEGDGDRYNLNATIGGAIDGGKGHIVFNVGYVKQNQITQAERPYGVTALDDLLDEVGSFTTPNGTVFDTSFPGDGEDGLVQFDAMGNAVPFANTFNFNPFNLYLAPQQKWTATTLARYELSDKVELFGRLSFAKNKVDTVIAPTGTFFESVPLNYADNPFLGPTARARFQQVDNAECTTKILDADDNWVGCSQPGPGAGDGLVDNLLGRRLVEIGTRDSFYENTAYQVVGGLTGDIFDEQTWEVFGQWGRTNRTQAFANDTSLSAAQAASIAITDNDPNSATFGQPICADAVFDPNTNTNNFVPSSNANCAPANFYGGMLSDAAGDFLRLNLNEINKTSQMVIGANLTGDTPWTIPSAESPLAYAVGIEYREEKGTALPDNAYATGNAIGFGASSPVDAQIEIVDYFLEGQIPLLQGMTGAQQLMLDFGIRYGDYSNKVGAVTNDFDNTSWKIGGEWAPIDSLRFRTSYQEAVRAPTIQEIGLPLTPSTGDLTTDPCSQEAAPQSAELTALCEATGVPSGNTG